MVEAWYTFLTMDFRTEIFSRFAAMRMRNIKDLLTEVRNEMGNDRARQSFIIYIKSIHTSNLDLALQWETSENDDSDAENENSETVAEILFRNY